MDRRAAAGELFVILAIVVVAAVACLAWPSGTSSGPEVYEVQLRK